MNWNNFFSKLALFSFKKPPLELSEPPLPNNLHSYVISSDAFVSESILGAGASYGIAYNLLTDILNRTAAYEISSLLPDIGSDIDVQLVDSYYTDQFLMCSIKQGKFIIETQTERKLFINIHISSLLRPDLNFILNQHIIYVLNYSEIRIDLLSDYLIRLDILIAKGMRFAIHPFILYHDHLHTLSMVSIDGILARIDYLLFDNHNLLVYQDALDEIMHFIRKQYSYIPWYVKNIQNPEQLSNLRKGLFADIPIAYFQYTDMVNLITDDAIQICLKRLEVISTLSNNKSKFKLLFKRNILLDMLLILINSPVSGSSVLIDTADKMLKLFSSSSLMKWLSVFLLSHDSIPAIVLENSLICAKFMLSIAEFNNSSENECNNLFVFGMLSYISRVSNKNMELLLSIINFGAGKSVLLNIPSQVNHNIYQLAWHLYTAQKEQNVIAINAIAKLLNVSIYQLSVLYSDAVLWAKDNSLVIINIEKEFNPQV